MIINPPKQGDLLIAEPNIIGDTSFHRAVVLLAELSDNGVVGFIINKPLQYQLSELIPEIKKDITVYNGGPVEQDSLFFLHTVPELIPNSIQVSEEMFWGGDFSIASELINNGTLSLDKIKFFLGYSGWEFDQLSQELGNNNWIVSKEQETVLSNVNGDFWNEKMRILGGNYLIWSNTPENPMLN
jgi:putative transcriptional regulator